MLRQTTSNSERSIRRRMQMFNNFFKIFFPDQPEAKYYIWMKNILDKMVLNSIEKKTSRVFTVEETHHIQVAASLSEEQMSVLNDEISNKIGRRLFYGKTTVRTFAKEERDNIETEIEVNTRGLAVFSHLESTIEWIMKLLEIDRKSKAINMEIHG